MTTFVDSSVLLDILIGDSRFASLSEKALAEARSTGRLAICEVVAAEIRPALGNDAKLAEFCRDLGLEYEPCSEAAAVLAGSTFADYLRNKGPSKRVVPDFLIAAQASEGGHRLLARDRGFYREYFRGLKLIDPSVETT